MSHSIIYSQWNVLRAKSDLHFDPRLLSMGFFVKKWHWYGLYPKYFGFWLSKYIPQVSILVFDSCITEASLNKTHSLTEKEGKVARYKRDKIRLVYLPNFIAAKATYYIDWNFLYNLFFYSHTCVYVCMIHSAYGLNTMYLCSWIYVWVDVRVNVTLFGLYSIFLTTSPSCNLHLFNLFFFLAKLLPLEGVNKCSICMLFLTTRDVLISTFSDAQDIKRPHYYSLCLPVRG